MKKIWICLLCLLLTVSAAACGGTGGESYASAEPSISEAESLPEASGSPVFPKFPGRNPSRHRKPFPILTTLKLSKRARRPNAMTH